MSLRKSDGRHAVGWATTMKLGQHLHALSRLRISVAVSALLAVAVAIWSIYDVRLLPPRLTPRKLEMATAYTQVMIDTPKSALLDLGMNEGVVQAMTNRALLVGSLVSTQPVLASIARRTGVASGILQVQAPSSPAYPQPRRVTGRSNNPVDLLRSPDQYRLDVTADPIVPFLNFYAQAPTATAAAALANGAVDGLNDYLRAVAASQRTGPGGRVALRQFGRARGTVINPGVDLQAAMLTFLFVFGAACAASVAIRRIRRGRRLATASTGH